jgi:hypothetical protein
MGFDRRHFLAAGLAALAGACQRANQGDMVVDAQTNRMYGMRSDGTPLFTDAALFPNRRLKLALRNMSGDPVWDLDATRERLLQAFLDKGYQRSDGEDFGLKVDLNVLRSCQYDRDMLNEFSFLGAAMGGLGGAAGGGIAGGPGGIGPGAGIGLATGAALGAIAGYYTADNIYVVVTEATFGIRRESTKPRRVVTFEGSPRVEEWEESGYGSFRKTQRVRIANYGGGRNVGQREIADEIRARQIRSLGSFL